MTKRESQYPFLKIWIDIWKIKDLTAYNNYIITH